MIRFADNKLANNIIKKNLECLLKKSLNEKERNETDMNISRKVRRLKQNGCPCMRITTIQQLASLLVMHY